MDYYSEYFVNDEGFVTHHVISKVQPPSSDVASKSRLKKSLAKVLSSNAAIQTYALKNVR